MIFRNKVEATWNWEPGGVKLVDDVRSLVLLIVKDLWQRIGTGMFTAIVKEFWQRTGIGVFTEIEANAESMQSNKLAYCW